MKKIISILCILFVVLGLSGCTKKKEIASYEVDDYCLTIYQVGDPVFPYGPTTCLLSLKQGSKIIAKEEIELLNDGANADESNFKVVFLEDYVEVTVNASEQEDTVYHLNYTSE